MYVYCILVNFYWLVCTFYHKSSEHGNLHVKILITWTLKHSMSISESVLYCKKFRKDDSNCCILKETVNAFQRCLRDGDNT